MDLTKFWLLFNIPTPEKEYRFHSERKWRFDFAWAERKIAVEVEGGIWIGGGHNRPVFFEKDMEKYNLATVEGWRVLRYSPQTLRKTPWKLIKDVRMLCSVSDDVQTTLSLDGYKQTKIESVQVKIS